MRESYQPAMGLLLTVKSGLCIPCECNAWLTCDSCFVCAWWNIIHRTRLCKTGSMKDCVSNNVTGLRADPRTAQNLDRQFTSLFAMFTSQNRQQSRSLASENSLSWMSLWSKSQQANREWADALVPGDPSGTECWRVVHDVTKIWQRVNVEELVKSRLWGTGDDGPGEWSWLGQICRVGW